MGWSVVYTQRGKEIFAQQELINQGFSVYVPRCKKIARHARTIKNIIVPLFPRYIFVQIDRKQQRWRNINATRGVSYLLTMNELPARVPDEIVKEIKLRETEDGLIKLPKKQLYKTGEIIEIKAGALTDQVGKFLRMDPRDRVVLLMQLMGRNMEVHLQRENVRAFA